MPYFVYMLASRRYGTLYIGVTNDLGRRVSEHKTKVIKGFTARYGVEKLVWAEPFDEIVDAIAYEKRIKRWRRDWKIRLIEESNPNSIDLFETLNR